VRLRKGRLLFHKAGRASLNGRSQCFDAAADKKISLHLIYVSAFFPPVRKSQAFPASQRVTMLRAAVFPGDECRQMTSPRLFRGDQVAIRKLQLFFRAVSSSEHAHIAAG
jgi:hypothetical protein